MINTIIVEDNIYMQNHFSSMLAGDERFNLIASLRDAFEAEKVCKTENVDLVLMAVINRTLAGERIFPDTSPNVEIKDMFSDDITPRQIDILRRFVKGMTYDEIDEDLKLSKNGVRWNLDQIIEKGGFQNKHELLAAVIENNSL